LLGDAGEQPVSGGVRRLRFGGQGLGRERSGAPLQQSAAMERHKTPETKCVAAIKGDWPGGSSRKR
jgi:hypothetical protein